LLYKLALDGQMKVTTSKIVLTAETRRRRERINFCRKARKNAQIKNHNHAFALFAFFAAKDAINIFSAPAVI